MQTNMMYSLKIKQRMGEQEWQYVILAYAADCVIIDHNIQQQDCFILLEWQYRLHTVEGLALVTTSLDDSLPMVRGV